MRRIFSLAAIVGPEASRSVPCRAAAALGDVCWIPDGLLGQNENKFRRCCCCCHDSSMVFVTSGSQNLLHNGNGNRIKWIKVSSLLEKCCNFTGTDVSWSTTCMAVSLGRPVPWMCVKFLRQKLSRLKPGPSTVCSSKSSSSSRRRSHNEQPDSTFCCCCCSRADVIITTIMIQSQNSSDIRRSRSWISLKRRFFNERIGQKMLPTNLSKEENMFHEFQTIKENS